MKQLLLYTLLLVSVIANSQNLRLEGSDYILNGQEITGQVDIVIYDWKYWVISADSLQDTVYYSYILTYKNGRDSMLRNVIVPQAEKIDSMSFGWDNNGYIRYANGDEYVFPDLWRIKKRRYGKN